jgi:hypothetical protein
MPEWIIQYWGEYLFGLIIVALGSVCAWIFRPITQLSVIRHSVQSMLRLEITREYNKWRDRGYCPIWAKECLEDLYKQYAALGGNGVGTHMYEYLMDLPTEPPASQRIQQRTSEMGESSPAG